MKRSHLISNLLVNLEERRIRTGFGFLDQQAGFAIGESFISFEPTDSYGRAFIAGLLNTLRVSILGIILATLLGIVMGISRLSTNWLVAKLASVYVEVTRNIPLLLQLFFWYTVITQLLPVVREALEPLPGVVLSKSGLQFPAAIYEPAQLPVLIVFALSVVAAFIYRSWTYKQQRATGQEPKLLLPMLGIILLPALTVFFIVGAPLQLDVPTFKTFNYRGGSSVTPEFLALLIGLSFYTGGFIAEIVRSGILGVPWGQSEASAALGRVLPRIARAVLAATGATAYNVLQNNGSAAGQEVMHVHFHIIPRLDDRGLDVVWTPGKLPSAEATDLLRKMRAALAES